MIESTQNKIIKKITALKNKKERDKTNLFILEGEKIISEIPDYWNIEFYILSESYYNNLHINLKDKYKNQYIIKDSLFKKISDTVNPQGIMAVCEKYKFNIDENIEKKNHFYVLLENIRDPGNLGTIIRTADAAGVDGVFLSDECVDLYNSKVLRSTMGSIFHVPIFTGLNFDNLIKKLKSNNIMILAAHLNGKQYPYNINLKNSCAILIGNEANGLTKEVSEMADKLVKIPLVGKSESLNASIACGILIYEVVRQRLSL